MESRSWVAPPTMLYRRHHRRGRNFISGNGDDGVDISGVGTTGNIVRGNFIGTNAAGTVAIANVDDGVSISDGASGNIIGEQSPARETSSPVTQTAGYRFAVRAPTAISSRGITSAPTRPAPLRSATSLASAPLRALPTTTLAERRPPRATLSPATPGTASPSVAEAATRSGKLYRHRQVRRHRPGQRRPRGHRLGRCDRHTDRWHNPGHRQRDFREYVLGRSPHQRGYDRQSDPGNRIGVAASSNAALGNANFGMLVTEPGNLVGGSEPAQAISSPTTVVSASGSFREPGIPSAAIASSATGTLASS